MSLLRDITIASLSSWATLGVVSSVIEPEVWRHHRSGRPTPLWGLLVIAMGPTLLALGCVPWFGMRNARGHVPQPIRGEAPWLAFERDYRLDV